MYEAKRKPLGQIPNKFYNDDVASANKLDDWWPKSEQDHGNKCIYDFIKTENVTEIRYVEMWEKVGVSERELKAAKM